MGLLVLSNSSNSKRYVGSSLGDKVSTKKSSKKTVAKKSLPKPKVDEIPQKHINRASKLNERFRKFEKLLGQKYYAFPYAGKFEIQLKKLVPSQLGDNYKDYRPISNGISVVDKWFSRWFDISLHDFETKPMEWIEKKLKKARGEMKIESPLKQTTAHEAPKKKSEPKSAKKTAEPKPKKEPKQKTEQPPAQPITKVETPKMTESQAEDTLNSIEKMLKEAMARKVA